LDIGPVDPAESRFGAATTDSSFVSRTLPHAGHSGSRDELTNNSACASQSWQTYS
jgi:hypothetical protein